MATDPIDGKLNHIRAAELKRVEQAYARRRGHDRYTFSDPAYLLAVQERERKLLRLLANHGYTSLENTKVLEIGCGTGAWLRDFVRWGARPENILGVDLLPARIAQARESCPAGVTLKCQDATGLDVPDNSFDLVLQSTVFTSIVNPEMKRLLAQEMLRVLRQSGMIIWYDFRMNNPRNPDVQGVSRNEIARLFPNRNISLQKLTLAPPLGRSVAPISSSLYRALSCIKPLCTHYLGAIKKS
jgi:ubiquinone/menaquinone biosynthesis C-methylase UbiE